MRKKSPTGAQGGLLPGSHRGSDGIVLLGPPSALAVLVLEIASLTETNLICCDELSEIPTDVALILALSGMARSKGAGTTPWVSIGEADDAADIRLPQQAHALAALLADVSTGMLGSRASRAGRHCLLVGGWHGGAGTSTMAMELARSGGALLLDASGHPPLVDEGECFHWGSVDPADPPLPTDLLRLLPRVDGIRRLGPLPGEEVRVTDARVVSVVARASCPAVIDAGVWNRSGERLIGRLTVEGVEARLVLVGRGTSHDLGRLTGLLAASSPVGMPRLLLGTSRDRESLQLAGEQFTLPVVSVPGGRLSARRRRDLWKRIWSG